MKPYKSLIPRTATTQDARSIYYGFFYINNIFTTYFLFYLCIQNKANFHDFRHV